MNTIPTPRTDAAVKLTFAAGHNTVCPNFARTLERELHESRNAERLARVQLGNERARLDELISVNATGAARLAHATAQLAAEREKVQRLVEINEFVGSAQLKAEREKVRALRLACERIVNQWDADHDTNPIGAGGLMYSLASKALGSTESENGGSNE